MKCSVHPDYCPLLMEGWQYGLEESARRERGCRNHEWAGPGDAIVRASLITETLPHIDSN